MAVAVVFGVAVSDVQPAVMQIPSTTTSAGSSSFRGVVLTIMLSKKRSATSTLIVTFLPILKHNADPEVHPPASPGNSSIPPGIYSRSLDCPSLPRG